MPDVILRGGRAQRVDVRVAKNQYTPSAKTVTSSGTDPATLSMQGYWRADYTGVPWVGTASLGGSGTSPDRDLEAGNVAGGGTPVNGYTPFFCDGASVFLVGDALMTWGDLIGTTNGDFYLHVLAQWNTAAATVGVLDDPALLTDNGGSYALSYSTDGVRFACYDNSGTPQLRTVGPATAAAGSYHMIQVWHDTGANLMWIQVDGGTAVSATLNSSDFGAGNAIKVAVNWADAAFADGDILEIAVTNDKLDANIRSDIRGYVQNKYAIAQGYTGTYTVASTQVHPLLFPRAVITGYANEDVYLYVDTDYVAPTIAPTYTQWVIDHVPAALQLRARVLAARQMHASVANLAPIVPPAAPSLVAVYAPDRIHGPSRAASILAQSTSIPPRPERTSPLASSVAPDRVVRPSLRTDSHQHGVMPDPKPERTSPMASVGAPDRIQRPTLSAAQQQASSTVSPTPERTIVLPTTDAPTRPNRGASWWWTMEGARLDPYPIPPVAPLTPVALTVQQDALPRRPGLAIGLHQWSGFGPAPERVSPIAATDAPVSVTRPFYRTTHQQSELSVSPRPERTSPMASTDAPVAVRRPWIGVAIQQAVTTSPPKPERTSPMASTLAPDAIARPSYRANVQQPTTTIPALPERTAPMATIDAPVAVRRPLIRGVDQQHATTVSPAPERTAPVATIDTPDRVSRPTLGAWLQQHATTQPPVPERTAPLAAVDAPGTVFRPSLGVGSQQTLIVALQPPVVPPAPLGVPLADFPAAIRRATYPAAQQVATEPFWPVPIPNEPAPLLSWAPAYPDLVRRASPRAVDHQAHAMAPKPERTAPLASVMVVDRPVRPTYPVTVQQAATTVHPKPERSAPIAATSHPDRVTRPVLGVALHQVVATSLYPERQSPIAAASHPDTVRRPAYRSEHQQAWTSSAQPERSAPIASAVDVARVVRPTYDVALQQGYATQVQPPPPPTFVGMNWSTSFPDEVRRPVLSVAHQWVAWSTLTPSTLSVTDPLTVVLAGLVSAADVVELVSIPVLGPQVSRADVKDIIARVEVAFVSRKA